MIKIKNATIKQNGRKTAGKSFFVDQLSWKVIIPTQIAYFLLEKVKEKLPFANFKIGIALYYLSLISSVPSRKKDKLYYKGYVPLHHQFLKSINYQYRKYFDYFLQIGILEKLSYDTWRGRSNRYRFNYKLIKKEGVEYLNFDYFNFEIPSIGRRQKLGFPAENALKTCPHLTQWFDHGLYIDYEQFLKDSENKFSINRFRDEAENYAMITKAQNYFYQAYELKEQSFRISRNPDTDNRFHSNLTNLSREIKKYVRYQDEEIVGLDVKNSQPYFLILFIENITKNFPEVGEKIDYRVERMRKIFRKVYNNKSTMMQRLSQCASTIEFSEEFNQIKDAILSGKYYEFLGEVFDDIKPDRIVKGQEIYERSFFDKNANRNVKKVFIGKRELMKKVSMQLLYTPLKRPSEYYVIFKKQYPLLCQFMEILKSSGEGQDSFKKFSQLLQHYEADCLLDFVTKQVGDKYPDMPLFTIHDSISTTWMWFPILQEEVFCLMNEYSDGMPPKLSVESWNPDFDIKIAA